MGSNLEAHEWQNDRECIIKLVIFFYISFYYSLWLTYCTNNLLRNIYLRQIILQKLIDEKIAYQYFYARSCLCQLCNEAKS